MKETRDLKGTEMQLSHTILALSIAALVLPAVAVAQDDEATDEIVVAAQKSMATLRRDLDEAEDDFYSLYNELNDDNEYDIRCSYEAPTGVRKKTKVCRPAFFAKDRGREDKTRRINPEMDPYLAAKMDKLQENLEALVAASPDLQAAMIRYNTARAQLSARTE
jgi:hypothetical protein